MVPYRWQQVSIDHAVQFLQGAVPGDRQLYSAPTGTGKSVIELAVQAAVPGSWIVSPRDEIIHGMLEKLDAVDEDPLSLRICTPVKLRNRLLKGELETPKALIIDESHHETAETYQQLDLLTGLAPAVGYTATPFRGSPRSTRQFLDRWGECIQLISIKEAVEAGYLSLPVFSMLPLVDDDVVEISSSGEFEVESLNAATVDRLGDMAEHARRWYSGTWDRTTLFALPSTACCIRLQAEMLKRGLPCAAVSASTPRSQRQLLFQALKARILAVLHINIISEGVDLPIRRLVDLAPTMSPVRWMQQLGRATRPTDEPPEYICTCRNLLRHAYILEGAVPTSAVVEAENSFPATQRPHVRVLGLEAIGRFKPASVKLRNGLKVYVYALSTASTAGLVAEYCCVVHPTVPPVWAVKVNGTDSHGNRTWGSWRACEPPADLKGFSSISPREPSEKQAKWWNRSARHFGIDSEQPLDRKSFVLLPVLNDLGVKL